MMLRRRLRPRPWTPIFLERDEAVATYNELVNITARNMYLGLLLIQNANSTYNKYKETLRSDFIEGFFRYPVSVEDAMSKLLENQTVNSSSRHHGGGSNRNSASGVGPMIRHTAIVPMSKLNSHSLKQMPSFPEPIERRIPQ